MKKLISCFLLMGFLSIPIINGSQDEMGSVFFYRVEEVNKLDSRKVAVKLEGKELISMPEDNFIGFRLSPGNYGLRMRQKQSEILLKVEPGRRYFIRVSQTVAGFGFNQSLTLMPEEQAIYQMRDMKPLEDKNIKDKSKEVIRDKPSHP